MNELHDCVPDTRVFRERVDKAVIFYAGMIILLPVVAYACQPIAGVGEAGILGYSSSEREYIITFENDREEKINLVMGLHPLAEYGLTYDAIKLFKPNYISDSHGKIRINRDLKDPPNTEEELYDFLENGIGALKPLTMRQVADKVVDWPFPP